MVDEPMGPASPIVGVRPGRNNLPDEDRAMLDERRKRQQGEGSGARDGQSQGGFGHEDIHDEVTVLGIPKQEMTASVRTAIDKLLDEINRLRDDLSHARGHEAYLEEQAQKDQTLHVMARRAFWARVNLSVRHVAEEKVQYSMIYIVVANAGAVQNEFGSSATQSLMQQAADVLREGVDPGDVVGSLEQSDFGVLLPGTPRAEAEVKAQRLIAAMHGRTFMWKGQEIGIQGGTGVAEVTAQDSADEVIARAKLDRPQS